MKPNFSYSSFSDRYVDYLWMHIINLRHKMKCCVIGKKLTGKLLSLSNFARNAFTATIHKITSRKAPEKKILKAKADFLYNDRLTPQYYDNDKFKGISPGNIFNRKRGIKVPTYYKSRYLFFKHYDRGICMDDVSWYSVTPEYISHNIWRSLIELKLENNKTEKLNGGVQAISLFSGTGSDCISAAAELITQFKKQTQDSVKEIKTAPYIVIGVELDHIRRDLSEHNINVYKKFGSSSLDSKEEVEEEKENKKNFSTEIETPEVVDIYTLEQDAFFWLDRRIIQCKLIKGLRDSTFIFNTPPWEAMYSKTDANKQKDAVFKIGDCHDSIELLAKTFLACNYSSLILPWSTSVSSINSLINHAIEYASINYGADITIVKQEIKKHYRDREKNSGKVSMLSLNIVSNASFRQCKCESSVDETSYSNYDEEESSSTSTNESLTNSEQKKKTICFNKS